MLFSAKIHFGMKVKQAFADQRKETKRTDSPAKPHYKNGSVVDLA